VTAADLGVIAGAYVVGSIPFGVVVGRALFGVDPRSVGSGNIGAANALRALGRVGAALVLAGDAVKGIATTAVVLHVLHAQPAIVAATGLATIVGHNWSMFLRFGGGKGVATGLGVVVVLSWQAAVAFGVVWLAVFLISRFASLSSLLANASVPIALLVVRAPLAYVMYGVIALALVVWRHESNIRRLVAGTELRFGTPKG
jgi:acyl phosphate:glycerol-3-phosphate acyltransferase